MYLHEMDRFKDLISVTAKEKKIDERLVEKDYWIMHVLNGMKNIGFDFYLKGGTSLSKAYHLIERFSEDLDMMIIPPNEMNVLYGKNHVTSKHIEKRADFFNWVLKKLVISGFDLPFYDEEELRDKKQRFCSIILPYSSLYKDKLEGLKSGILLEVGFAKIEPYSSKDITSWAYDFAKIAGMDCIDNRALKIKCYNPEYTLVEKLQAISTKFRNFIKDGSMQRNFLRHYYDVYMLLKDRRILKFIGTPEYVAHKDECFRSDDEKDLSINEAFVLSDPNIFEILNTAYEKSSLYYKDRPSLKEILDGFKNHLHRL